MSGDILDQIDHVPAFISVISATAPQDVKDAAEGDPYTFVCTGENDQNPINEAISLAHDLWMERRRKAMLPFLRARYSRPIPLKGGVEYHRRRRNR